MIKTISSRDLKVGMYIHDLNCDWMSHPFLRPRFKVRCESEIEKIVEAGIHEVYIDVRKGLDVPAAPSAREADDRHARAMLAFAEHEKPLSHRCDAVGEMGRAREVHDEASRIVRGVMQDVRLGRQVALERVEPTVERIVQSILGNNGALLSLCRIRDKDEYTFQHSVSVGALMVSFCNALEMDAGVIQDAGVGGMLHDIGKMRIPDPILNKPGRLTEEEFAAMRCHVIESRNILEATPGISRVAVEVAAQHHERYDGSGYPEGLKGEQISEMGQMAAIVDVYDAITSDRCYRRGLAPTDALRKLFEWSRFHFNPRLVQAFIRSIGIYPVGTLVALESGRLGVVLEQNAESLIAPKVKTFYCIKTRCYIPPETVDLSRSMGHGGGDRIVSHESPEVWRVDPLRQM